ncbi:response regulator transcription factor [Trueperella pecoris]|uniref:response regulator transcription factor n=1 Tax=Trueperella pecoris TaxID=2733571 RepID=UPI001ABE95C5|nr:response regulator transcription factor [Trueperella pecoris]QTG76129.1 response regulator transcription factor [Trueperella pecoris]
MKPRALVVDDEPQMLAIVAFSLETKGFTCVSAASVAEAWRHMSTYEFHLAVVDIMLPHGSGLELTRRIRAQSDLPIILLTARSDVEDRIEGLEAGADDYLTKPFSPQELALRAQALLRRSFPAEDGRDRLGGLAVNMDFLEATWHGRKLNVSGTEVRLLAALMRHGGDVATHRQLLNEAWGVSEAAGGREMVKTAIYRVRKTLEKSGVGVVIRSHRGEGYSIALQKAEEK